jgi:ATP synthase protein I
MWLQASKFGYLGIFFGVAITIGYLVGSWLDRKFGAEPWLTIVWILVGVAAGFRELIRVSRQYQKEQEKQ